MVKKKFWIFAAVIFIIVIAISGILLYKNFNKPAEFSRTSLIRMNLPKGGEINYSVKINNPSKETQNFKIYLNNFEELALISEKSFSLGPKDSKEIMILFKDNKNKPEVYIGKLIIEGGFGKGEIPVILGVEDPSRAFAIIPSSIPKYDSVYLGGKLGIEIKVFDLISANIPTVNSFYIIKNFDDEILIQGNADLIVDGSKTEIIDIPLNWMTGDYVFISYINYKGTTSFSSYLFSVSNKSKGGIFPEGFELFIVGILVFVALIFGAVIYFVRTRDALLIELKKQQNRELQRNLEYIKRSRKEIAKSREKPEKKKKKLEGLKKVKQNILNKLKQKQKKQRQEVHKLKKSKKKDAVKRKLEQWKREGYKMFETGEEIKKITKKGIDEQMKDWRAKGYDVSFLTK